ncbi:hypothetical protein [Ruegeria sp. YS9]|uniref:hypothetical protein n=1 Tax=Ruegeria sp. YS9 TaxID=2966453 RepID=UPI00214B08D3|nr:hypothetical protein [Ruegeria sp. YS9]UUV08733.1 hypothetical protein NOR97_21065 [Ruegeria sp. YS9]
MIKRRLFFCGVAVQVLFGSATISFAQDCNSENVEQLKKSCIAILRDVAATIQTGRNLETVAWGKGQESIKPSYDCLKGGYDLGVALFKDCNPSSPGVNPIACVQTLVGVPDTIKACEAAISLVQEAWSLYEQAKFLYGTADVAFSDQGGNEIAEELKKCGEPGCLQLAQALSEYAQQNRDRAQRNQDRLKEHENQLVGVKGELEACQQDSSSCDKIQQYQVPELEPIDAGPPDIILN